jgi:subtilisin family serine protease
VRLGTFQAAAVLAGSVALLLQARPALTPDQVKALLKKTGWTPLLKVSADSGGKIADIWATKRAPVPATKQTWPASAGKGTLEGARDSIHISDNGSSCGVRRRSGGRLTAAPGLGPAPARRRGTAPSGWASN